MMPATCWRLLFALPVLGLAGCGMLPTQHNADTVHTAQTGPTRTFVSKQYGIRLRYPADLVLQHGFKRSYLNNGDWTTYAGPDAPPGKALVALVMPESDRVTDGELRIGVSRQPRAVKTCTRLPAAARRASAGHAKISGVDFTTYKAADAAMSHYLTVRSFRAVHNNTCYAMDVLVYGTNPNVYDPPVTPPFSKERVFQRLIPVAHALQFFSAQRLQRHDPDQ